MAAVSAPHAASVPPQAFNSRGNRTSWHFDSPHNQDYDQSSQRRPSNSRQYYANGNNAQNSPSRPEYGQRDTYESMNSNSSRSRQQQDNTHLGPHVDSGRKDSQISGGSGPDSLLDLYGTNSQNHSRVDSGDYGGHDSNNADYHSEEEPDSSRWIHRDKLAEIESQELQAAGIILPPTPRASRKASRSRSRDKLGNKPRRKGSIPLNNEGDEQWDLRTPEEAAEDYNPLHAAGARANSRIPVPKTSPLPLNRKKSGSLDQDPELPVQKSRGRSHSVKALDDSTITQGPRRIATDVSPPKKTSTTPRKASAPPRTTTSTTRPKTGNRAKGRDNSNGRPQTRGDNVSTPTTTRRPEGDPPWLATMYKPDPRLPPDQQLLPTVAKRLQQEQWEKEGKFGTTYDKDFRPLNDEPFGGYPDPSTIPGALPPDPSSPTATEKEGNMSPRSDKRNSQSGWPLSGDQQKESPRHTTSSGSGSGGGSGSYSTMPKISTGTPQGIPPMASPKPAQIEPPSITRQPTLPEENEKKKGGCCIVM